MGSEHTAKAFDSDLQELTRLVAEMGGLAERMIVDSVDALIRRDVALGQRVVASDAEIDNVLSVNLVSALYALRAFVRAVPRGRPASVVLFSSGGRQTG